ncbi:hypothetical protein [Prochlorococcus sp. MIT 1307]|uniref:hypothetical protein n=1 Tax=Prochlorococcus sp. MIT 1307 TaxID=3096219 RepID=UPI002A75A277|nr:hypothetical protein [Prochlorococcus sp. MIT 1307]
MNKRKPYFNPAAGEIVNLNIEFQILEREFKKQLIRTHGKDRKKSKQIQTGFRHRQSPQVNTKKTIEIFILGILFLFAALEEAEWLICSAKSKDKEAIEDLSSWNVNTLFTRI